MSTVYTVGHSSHAPEPFQALLRQHGVQVVVDTRSVPVSRYAPHFDREPLREMLTARGARYLWLGDAVGGRPRDQACYDADGRVLYGRVAAQPEFREAVERVKRGAEEFRVALLCSEEDPAHCHRRLLIARVLIDDGVNVLHIRGDGTLESDEQVARKSGKPLVQRQAGLFGDMKEAAWRSTGVVPGVGFCYGHGFSRAICVRSKCGFSR